MCASYAPPPATEAHGGGAPEAAWRFLVLERSLSLAPRTKGHCRGDCPPSSRDGCPSRSSGPTGQEKAVHLGMTWLLSGACRFGPGFLCLGKNSSCSKSL